jgi:hypothetical protein
VIVFSKLLSSPYENKDDIGSINLKETNKIFKKRSDHKIIAKDGYE